MLQTEFEFTLPKGYVDADGTLHREGTMRLSTGADDVLPLADPRVQNNPAYFDFILLSRVVIKLGSLEHITPKTMESMFSSDLDYLRKLCSQINGYTNGHISAKCPECQHTFEVEAQPLGEL